MMDKNMYEETMRHRKKKDQQSKSSKRSDHKHQYEKCIAETMIGWSWAKACKICGRFKSGKLSFFNSDSSGLRYPEKENYAGYCKEDFYTLEELRQKYPYVKIYTFNNQDETSDFDYVEVKPDQNRG